MASAFSFGFAGDDIDIDVEESDVNVNTNIAGDGNGGDSLAVKSDDGLPELVEARRHEMGEWFPTLPSLISYNKLPITTPNGSKTITLARREVFDIRTQLMAEDNSVGQDNDELIAGLEKGDIKPHFYEGGFKTWECALDLARLVVGEDEDGLDVDLRGEERHVIELGAGTAIPSLALLAQLLSSPSPSPPQHKTHFTFADYNAAVLRLVTLPNILLTWNEITSHRKPSSGSSDPTRQDEDIQDEEELDITPELLETFSQDLSNRGITIDFISGAWSPSFVDLVFSSAPTTDNNQGLGGAASKRRTLILASETIYSPAALGTFSETLLALLRRSSSSSSPGTSQSRSLVAAKKVYFGVGGGVDEFLAVLRGIAGAGVDVRERLDVKSEGVGRVILEIVGAI